MTFIIANKKSKRGNKKKKPSHSWSYIPKLFIFRNVIYYSKTSTCLPTIILAILSDYINSKSKYNPKASRTYYIILSISHLPTFKKLPAVIKDLHPQLLYLAKYINSQIYNCVFYSRRHSYSVR